MKRAVDLGPLDAAAIRTRGGKIRLRLHFSVEQLESMLRAAVEGDDDEATDANVDEMKRSVTQCNAPESEKTRPDKIHDGGDARASPATRQFVIEGTRAWDAWVAEKLRTTGVRWDLTTTATVDGKSRRGWYFPSLFPPSSDAAKLTDSDSAETVNL